MSGLPAAPDQIVHVVDDDEALRDSLVWMLEANGYTVAAHASADSFLVGLTDGMTGCVLLDVRMPGMSGLEALQSIRDHDPAARVLMVSAMGQQKMIVEALEYGAMDFLVKPFQPTKVLETVKKCLQAAPRD